MVTSSTTIFIPSPRNYVGPVKTTAIGEKILEGKGVYTWEDAGIVYEGPFRNSQIMGSGKCTWADGRTYEGEFFNGKRHGKGTFVAYDGYYRYSGGWEDGKREGLGTMIYAGEGEGLLLCLLKWRRKGCFLLKAVLVRFLAARQGMGTISSVGGAHKQSF